MPQITRDGRPFVKFQTWLAALPEAQQREYHAARARQHSFRQQAIDRGDMRIEADGSYIWKDQATMNLGKPQDPVWAAYHDRWVQECAIEGEAISQITETSC